MRGLNARAKRSSLRKIISTYGPTFVFIQETKMEDINKKMVRTCWKSDDIEWLHSPSIGNSGGILSIWIKSIFTINSHMVTRHWLAISGIFPSLNFECTLINIYNPCDVSQRADIWREISTYQKANPCPCLIIGDFNEILKAADRGSLNFSQTGIDNLKEFMQEHQFLEIPSTSGGFTWFRGNSKSIIDRLIVSPEWITTFPSIKMSLLQRGLSDHCPLYVHSQARNWGPKPFRFLNCWLTDPKCMNVIKSSWKEAVNQPITEKFRTVKRSLKEWNHNEFGNIDANIKKLENTIQHYDNVNNERDLDSHELETRKQAQVELWQWIKRKELYWAQQSRIRWLKEGDRNTKFFHTVASNKRRKNTIGSIEVNGEKVDDPSQIKSEAVKFFKSIFREEFSNRPIFEDLQFNKISPEQATSLTLPFSNEEIDTAVASCDSDKAPGPDGFNFKFIKSAWETVKEDMYQIVHEFWAKAQLPRGSNTAYIALIPKISNPSSFKDYRPISMVGCIYKIVAKLMARRLQGVMSDLVAPLQSAYIEGRQILDGALVASEIIDSCKKKGTKATLLKLDFHKAYDSVSWSFLQWILEKMNFPPQWCEWIMTCVSTASASILINGSPSMPFKLQRGLRQGDPLSPFLFVLIVEALNQMIGKATSLNLWSGVETCKNGMTVTHLQYADDTLIFCDASLSSLKNIKQALILFHLASGLQFNFHKSSLMGINTQAEWLQDAAKSLLCKTGHIPFTYLGLPIGGNLSRIQAWDPIIEKLSKKLATWKGKMLSIGGRITLIKSSISNLPLYYMSLFPIPKGVVEKINKITRAFLWSGDMEKRSIPLVSWKLIQLPKSLGGLSIGNIIHKNLALLCKWIWRLFHDPSSLWSLVIRDKYKYPQTFSISDLSIPSSGGPWRHICAAIFNNTKARSIIINGMRKNIGSGSSTFFWHDPWLCATPLKKKCPRLFLIAVNKNAKVEAQGFWEGYNWIWSFEWQRTLRPRDLAEKKELDNLLSSVCPAHETNDKCIWAYNKAGIFSTKSVTLELDKLGPLPQQDAIKGLWRGLVPHRIEIFVWTALLGRINTRNKLASLGIIPPESDVCPLCSASSETSAHLLLHCSFSQQLWYWWLDLWHVKWAFPNSLRDAFDQWKCPEKKPIFFKKVWVACFFIILWTVWKERNLRIFGDSHTSISSLKDLILLRLGWWITGWCDKFPYSPMDITRNPSCLVWSGEPTITSTATAVIPQEVWTPPDFDHVKWNVDASISIPKECSAIGGVLRNHQGYFKCLFSSPIPFMEINCAEVLAIHRAITITLASDSLKRCNVILESDSSNAVQWCNSAEGGPWNMNYFLNFIRNARKRDLKISIVHKRRSTNFVADSMAKQGLHRRGEFIAWL